MFPTTSTIVSTTPQPLFKPPHNQREIWFFAAIVDLLVDNLFWFYESYDNLIESYEAKEAWDGAWQVSFSRIHSINERLTNESLFYPFEKQMDVLTTYYMNKLATVPVGGNVSEQIATSEALDLLVPSYVKRDPEFLQLMTDYWLSEEAIAEHYAAVADIIYGDYQDRQIIPLLVGIAANKFSPQIVAGVEYTLYPGHAVRVLERLVDSNDPIATCRFFKPTTWTALYPLSSRFEIRYR